jgi:hypothetical protein
MTRRHRRVGLVAALLVASLAVIDGSVGAVETDVAISTTAIDFGEVNVGATATVSVTLTNTGGDPFGPINMFGGAPPTAEFNASQNCQAQTLPAGGSCSVNYSFSPGSTGNFTDSSNFTVSETASQSDGEDFSVSLSGVGFDPNAATTTSTTSTTLDTTSTSTTTTTPSASASPAPTPSAGTTPSTAPAATTTTSTTVAAFLPLTGVATPRPALVVKVDNVDAEPQAGLNDADLVFEEIVEGDATRFAAVFNSTEAHVVGPIRSARTQDVDLLLGLNDPALAYSGANDSVNGALQSAGIELLSEGAPGFFRRDDLPAPHNLFADVSQLWPQLVSSGNAASLFQYAPSGPPPVGTPVSFAELTVGANPLRWDWDPTLGLLRRSQGGDAHQLVDGQVTATTVVVLVVEYGVDPNGGPEAQTVGTGAATVFSGGVRIDGTWTRSAPTAPFTLTDAAGQAILLPPGRTWVELADGRHGLTTG